MKHLEFVSGVYVTTYWISNAVWDFLNALIPVLISTAVFYALPLNAYSGDGLIAVFLLLVSAPVNNYISNCHSDGMNVSSGNVLCVC